MRKSRTCRMGKQGKKKKGRFHFDVNVKELSRVCREEKKSSPLRYLSHGSSLFFFHEPESGCIFIHKYILLIYIYARSLILDKRLPTARSSVYDPPTLIISVQCPVVRCMQQQASTHCCSVSFLFWVPRLSFSRHIFLFPLYFSYNLTSRKREGGNRKIYKNNTARGMKSASLLYGYGHQLGLLVLLRTDRGVVPT